MTGLYLTLYDLAERWLGIREVAGVADHPLILGMLRLDQAWPTHDEVPWCSAFVNFLAWQLDLPRSRSLAARSWLTVGAPVSFAGAQRGFDVVVLRRAGGPGPEVTDAPGHVGLFRGLGPASGQVYVLGGNQSNAVSVASFDARDVLGVRRLWPPTTTTT